jgi:glycosyltransferase involved in cell wall biosynthesis
MYMKVLLVTAHDVWGGLDGHSPLTRIMLGLAESGHDVLYVSSDKTGDPSTTLYGPPVSQFHPRILVRRIRIPGDRWLRPLVGHCPVIRSIYDRSREILFIALAAIYCLARAATFKPDLIYGYEIYGALVGRVVAALLGTPLVTRFQGTLLPPLLTRARKSLLARLSLVTRYYIHLLALRTPADLLIMTDDGTLGQDVVRSLGNQSPLLFWSNGTDYLDGTVGPAKAGPSANGVGLRQYGISEGSPVIISVSRLAAWKRVDRILQAFPLVLKRVPEAWYVIVGDGTEGPRLVQMAEALGIQRRVVFAGHLPQAKGRQLLFEAGTFVSMNDLTNVGNPLIEALCLGKPIVTYDVGNTCRVIQQEENGLLLNTDAPEAVADALVRLLTDARLAKHLSEGARRYALDHFWTWEQRIRAEVDRLEALVPPRSQQHVEAS